jgi:hypothetical protein
MEDLIINARKIFEDPAAPNSPPLPPTPAIEPVPVYYGSRSTKVANVPPNPPTAERTGPGSPQDFTPRLPPRPAGSIHPSSRITHTNSSPHKQRPDASYPLSPDTTQEVDPDAISLPPSPSAINSNLSLSSLAGGHSQATSEDTQHTQEARPETPPPPLPPRDEAPPPKQNVYPFPTATPEGGTPTKPDNLPAKDVEDPFLL